MPHSRPAGGCFAAGCLSGAADLILTAATIGGDEEAEKRRDAVLRTAARIAAGDDATGRPALAKYLDAKVIDTVEDWLQLRRETTGGTPGSDAAPRPRPQIWTHADLLAADFPELEWRIADFVPDDSLVILGGKKKRGKSWMALQMARAVAAGAPFLGRTTRQGPVLYLCLEDGERRLRDRLKRQGATAAAVPGLHFAFELDRKLNEGGIDDVEEQIRTTGARFVVVDTLAAAKSGKVDENAAGEMGDLLNRLRGLAQQQHTSVAVSRDDPGDDVRGSSAVGAASDVNLGLYRAEGGYVLKAEGRDIPDTELRLRFEDFTWYCVGDARELARKEGEDEILEALAELGEADASAVARHLGRSRSALVPRLRGLLRDGLITSRRDPNAKGGARVLYRLCEPPPEGEREPDRQTRQTEHNRQTDGPQAPTQRQMPLDEVSVPPGTPAVGVKPGQSVGSVERRQTAARQTDRADSRVKAAGVPGLSGLSSLSGDNADTPAADRPPPSNEVLAWARTHDYPPRAFGGIGETGSGYKAWWAFMRDRSHDELWAMVAALEDGEA